MDYQLRKEIINFIRKETVNETATIYDYFGYEQGSKKLPLWYSDTCKLCYPDEYFSENEVKEVVEKLKKKFGDKISVRYSEHYIGGLHCGGYCIKID